MMTRTITQTRSLAPQRHKPAPATGCFGFTKSNVERVNRELLDSNPFHTKPDSKAA